MVKRSPHAPTPMTDAQRALAECPDHLDAAAKIANQWRLRLPPYVHYMLLSAAYRGLVTAALKYREGTGACFKTYANYAINGSIIDELRQLLPAGTRRVRGRYPPPIKRVLSLSLMMGWDDRDVGRLREVALAPEPESMEDSADEVRRILRAHPVSRNREVAAAYFCEPDATMAALATRYGLSESRVSMIIGEVVRDVRASLGVTAPTTTAREHANV